MLHSRFCLSESYLSLNDIPPLTANVTSLRKIDFWEISFAFDDHSVQEVISPDFGKDPDIERREDHGAR